MILKGRLNMSTKIATAAVIPNDSSDVNSSSRRYRGNHRPRRPNRQSRKQEKASDKGTQVAESSASTSSLERKDGQQFNTSQSISGSTQARGSLSVRNANRPPVEKPRARNIEKIGLRMSELGQLAIYLKPNFTQTSDTTWLCKLKPSDPDFAFDIEYLEFVLTVPLGYPKHGQALPYILVKNGNIPKGYSINVERGYASIAQAQLGKRSLLDIMLEFDKGLEGFLQQQKGQTIKLVKFSSSGKKTSVESAMNQNSASNNKSNVSSGQNPTTATRSFNFALPPVFIPNYIKEETTKQINLLIARLKDQASIKSVSESETVVSIKITAGHSEILPQQLNETFTVLLHVPKNYGISPCTIDIPLDLIEARNIERNFNLHAASAKSWSLLALMNFLTVQLDSLILSDEYIRAPLENVVGNENSAHSTNENQSYSEEALSEQDKKLHYSSFDTSTSGNNSVAEHAQNEDNNLLHEELHHREVSDDNEAGSEHVDEEASSSWEFAPLKSSGTALNFVNLELSNVALLECNALSLEIQCSRCKSRAEMHLVSGPYGRESKAVTMLCAKCNHIMAAAFRKNLMFTSNANVGYIDLAGCLAHDYLPSMLVATCGECSTNSFENAFRRVEIGRKTVATCHQCHTKMSITINGFNFDVIDSENLSKEKINAKAAKLKARGKEGLNLTGGTPLPNKGSCEHYKKSNRWFRFSCCSKVFPCDRCHNAGSNHFNERANRMICGFCSREQNFAAECQFCGHAFEHKFSPFWEGGKGTRDKVKMSKKDSRKYKRRGNKA